MVVYVFYIYIIGVLTVNISFMWRGLETGERRNGNRPNGNVQIVDEMGIDQMGVDQVESYHVFIT